MEKVEEKRSCGEACIGIHTALKEMVNAYTVQLGSFRERNGHKYESKLQQQLRTAGINYGHGMQEQICNSVYKKPSHMEFGEVDGK